MGVAGMLPDLGKHLQYMRRTMGTAALQVQLQRAGGPLRPAVQREAGWQQHRARVHARQRAAQRQRHPHLQLQVCWQPPGAI